MDETAYLINGEEILITEETKDGYLVCDIYQDEPEEDQRYGDIYYLPKNCVYKTASDHRYHKEIQNAKIELNDIRNQIIKAKETKKAVELDKKTIEDTIRLMRHTHCNDIFIASIYNYINGIYKYVVFLSRYELKPYGVYSFNELKDGFCINLTNTGELGVECAFYRRDGSRLEIAEKVLFFETKDDAIKYCRDYYWNISFIDYKFEKYVGFLKIHSIEINPEHQAMYDKYIEEKTKKEKERIQNNITQLQNQLEKL